MKVQRLHTHVDRVSITAAILSSFRCVPDLDIGVIKTPSSKIRKVM